MTLDLSYLYPRLTNKCDRCMFLNQSTTISSRCYVTSHSLNTCVLYFKYTGEADVISKGEDRETKCSDKSSCKESSSYCMTPVSLDIRHFAADSSL